MSYGKARKKPVSIHFFKWGKGKSEELHNWVETFGQDFFEHFEVGEGLKVKTLEGTSYDVPEGYIIIRGVQGEYYPCEPEIFKNTYQIITLHRR